MTPKRNRSLHVSVGVMTALSLGVATLAGCASFDPNPAATGQKPVTPAATTGGAAATTPAGGAATPATAMTNLSGTANLGGKPMANATIVVLNAFTDKPVAGLVAAGAGNLVAAGAGNLVAAGAGNYGLTQATTIKTDANGNYSVNMPELGNSDMVRIVAVSEDGKTSLMALAAGAGNAAAGYALTQATTTSATGRKDFKVKIDVSSTLSTGAMSGVISLFKSMTPANRAAALTEFVAESRRIETSFDNALAANPEGEAALIEKLNAAAAAGTGATTGTGTDLTALGVVANLNFKAVEAALKAAGYEEAAGADFSSLVMETFKDVLNAAVDGLTEIELSKEDFPPSIDINLDKIAEGTISYVDPKTGEIDTVTVEIVKEPVIGETPIIIDPIVDPIFDAPIIEEDPIEDSFSAEGKFKPGIVLEYDSLDSDSPLRMKVTQADGEFDVKKITATLPISYVASTNLAQTSGTVVNSTAETTLTDGWLAFGAANTHKITANSGNTTSQFNGVWKVGTTTVANVAITKTTSELKVVFTFAMTGNEALETVGGTIGLEALKSLVELKTSELALQTSTTQPVTIIIDSRSGADLTATTTDAAARAEYHRNITLIK